MKRTYVLRTNHRRCQAWCLHKALPRTLFRFQSLFIQFHYKYIISWIKKVLYVWCACEDRSPKLLNISVARLRELAPYYKICKALLSTLNSVTKSAYEHKPNQYYSRTDGIFLVEIEIVDNSDLLLHLFTPFGRFQTFHSGTSLGDELAMSFEFLKKRTVS